MHRHQWKYRLWHRYWLHFPILKIRPYAEEWDAEKWLNFGYGSSVLCFEEKGETR